MTVFACLLSVAFGSVLLLSADLALFRWLPLVLFVRMAMNAIDGMLAREFGQASRLGAYLNELGDVISDAFLILPFAYLPGITPFWVWTVVVLAVISELAGALATPRRNDGPMGKSDRAVVFGAAGLWVGFGFSLPNAVPIVIAGLIAITVIQRVRKGLEDGHASF